MAMLNNQMLSKKTRYLGITMYDSWLVRHGFQGDGACQLYSYSWDGAFFS